MMQGEITLTQARELRVHTFTAPDKGRRVNSHIIELPSQLLVIDSQYFLPYAREVVSSLSRSAGSIANKWWYKLASICRFGIDS
jgi:hypothetical protein